MLVPDRHRLGLVFQNLDAHPVRRLDIGLIQPAVVAGQHRNAGSLPLRYPFGAGESSCCPTDARPVRRVPPVWIDVSLRRITILNTRERSA